MSVLTTSPTIISCTAATSARQSMCCLRLHLASSSRLHVGQLATHTASVRHGGSHHLRRAVARPTHLSSSLSMPFLLHHHRGITTTTALRQAVQSSSSSSSSSSASSTVDAEEVARLSEGGGGLRWWDPEGQMRPLHRMNPKRVAYMRTCLTRRLGLAPFAPRPFTGLRFLDVGCGPGLLTESLARLGGEVLGVDASEANIKTAIRHAGDDPSLLTLSYRAGTAEALANEGLQFDIVCSLEVIEHVNNPELFLRSLCRLIKPGGSLFLSTINRTIKSYALAIVGAEHILRWVPPGTHQWNKFVQPTEIGVLLQRERMNVEELTGLAYKPLSGSWSFTTDTSVNYLLWATKPVQ